MNSAGQKLPDIGIRNDENLAVKKFRRDFDRPPREFNPAPIIRLGAREHRSEERIAVVDGTVMLLE
jgi:hypothetical protein